MGEFMIVLDMICRNHGGKMWGMWSLSTSPLENPWCKSRCEKGVGICKYCYSVTYQKLRKALREKLKRNTEVLTTRILADEELPILNVSLFRFEAFGDLVNEIQVQNYFNLCRKNPQTKFALWTKNPWIIQKVLDQGIKKPKNLKIIFSLIALNSPVTFKEAQKKWSFIDKIFTVYEKPFIKENGVKINCGTRKCIECRVCYENNRVREIKEEKK